MIGYLKNIRSDIIPGLIIAFIVLPQAIAFSFLAGVPPHFGLYCAIYGVLIVAILNPSYRFHGGPNSSVAVAIGVALLPYAPQFGADYMGLMLSLAVMVGIFQLGFATIRPLARLLDFMSEAVVSGMIFGIGLFLIFKSIATFGGLPLNTDVHWPLQITWQTMISVVDIGNPFAIEVGFVTLVSAIIAKSFVSLKRWYLLVGLVAGTAYAEFLNASYGGLMVTQLEQIGNIKLPILLPSIPTFTPEALPDLLSLIPSAFAIALLGIIQTVAIVRKISRTSGVYTSSMVAIRADAISNILAGFISAMPGSGSFNRVALMQSFNVKTRWAAIFSALILFALIYFAESIIAIISLPSMAAIIMLVGANMLKINEIKHHFNSKIETIVFLSAFLSVHIFGLLDAVLISASFAFINWVWHKSHPNITVFGTRVTISGEMYYASIPVVEPYVANVLRSHNVLSIDLSRVSSIDEEAGRWLESICRTKNKRVTLFISNKQQAMISQMKLLSHTLDGKLVIQ